MSEPYRHISVDSDQGVLVLTILETRLNEFELAEGIGKEMIDAVSKCDTKKVVVNMKNIEYMASVGYKPFLSLRRNVIDSGGRLLLCNLSQFIADVFNAPRLINPKSESSLFQAADTLSDAIAMFNA